MTYVLGLSGGYFHDSSACLVRDGVLLAYSEEERWSRRKQNRDSRTCSCSVLSCLEQAKIDPADIHKIAISWNPAFPNHIDSTSDASLRQEILSGLPFLADLPVEFTVIDHHLSHAASSFYSSGFEDAVVLVIDGSGDGVSTTLWKANQSKGLQSIRTLDFRHSLGWFYETATEYVGFNDWSSAGKFMGLASYGTPADEFNDIISLSSEGYELKYDLSATNNDYASLDYYWRLKKYLFTYFEKRGVTRALQKKRYLQDKGLWENQTEFNQVHKDFAASVQNTLQRCIASLVEHAVKTTGLKRICLAGGVALNCAANGFLCERFPDLEIFICPFANDSGCSVGAAMEVSRQVGRFAPTRLHDAGIGPEFSDDTIAMALNRAGLRYWQDSDFPKYVAGCIADGKIVGWFQGRAEAGPRALGHRSILGDPRKVGIRDRVNRDVKTRELWRPLCPSIIEEQITTFSDSRCVDDFMLIAQKASSAARQLIPGVVHVDGTMRCQRVRKSTNPAYYSLLTALESENGVPVVLNTSFNAANEPIVGTPLDAIRTFISTDLDVLSIGSFIVSKLPQ
jgi:carbamoyltransferase